MPHALSVLLNVSSADPGILILSQKVILSEDPMELRSLTESLKMKQQTHPPPQKKKKKKTKNNKKKKKKKKKQMIDETAQKPKCTIFPSLFGGEEV